uniref:Transposase (putative) gypsy type domain-containing protein n=1 Tax=Fagus sylvatica TaxID=28930 RepID=A0A2N9GIP4_FAGSY
MAKTKKTQGKLARYVNTPEAMERFRRHYGVPDDVYLEYRFWENAITGEHGDLIIPVVAIIEGGVRFPIDPLLADFLDHFRISPTQINPNIFRIVNGVAELNRRLGFNLTVHDIIATYFLRTTQHEAFSLRPRDVNNTLVNGLPDTNKEMTDDFLLVRGNWYFPGHQCPTKDGKPEEKKKQIQTHLTDPVALQAVYDSEVCVDEYANPRSAYKLLRYIPSARSFLQCRQVSNLAAALANPANKSPPAHDIREMAGINLKKLLPPRPQAETSEPILPLKRKRKGAPKGEASQAAAPTEPDTASAASKMPEARPVLPGVDTLPSTEDADVEMVGPFIPERDPISSGVLAPFWAPPLEAQGERVRTDATVLRTGGSGSSTASALCEVARLPVDMDMWRKSTNQEVINNLRRGLMMAVQGSLEIGDRFQRQTADLENSLRVATRSVHLKSESERMRREVEAYKEQVRIATLKKDEADLKLEDTQDLLRNALEENSKAGERIQALEAEIAAREKTAFNRGSVEAQTTMTKQLPGIYNEAFQVGWKALYSWESDDMPPLPPPEVFPYPNAPIGVPEEELPESQASS